MATNSELVMVAATDDAEAAAAADADERDDICEIQDACRSLDVVSTAIGGDEYVDVVDEESDPVLDGETVLKPWTVGTDVVDEECMLALDAKVVLLESD